MIIGLSGHSGFIGKKLHLMLLENNFEVITFGREASSLKSKHVYFDLNSPDSLHIPKDIKIDTIIHAAAYVHKDDNYELQHISNFLATKALYYEGCKAGLKEFIFLSSVGVYGVSFSDQVISLSSLANPSTNYGKSKLLSEDFLLSENNKGVRILVLRLPLVYGDGAKGNYASISKLATSGIPLPFKGVKNLRSLISVEMVSRIITLYCLKKIHIRGIHLLSEEIPFSTEEIISYECLKNNIKPRLFYFPKFLIKIFLKIIGKEKVYHQLYENLIFKSSINLHDSQLK